MRRMLALLLLAGCGVDPYIELQIADDRLPFLDPATDFDALGVSARSADCAATEVRYPARALPATLTVQAGDCYRQNFELQAFAELGTRRVAESQWLPLELPSSGVLVVTATLAQLPGPRVRFRTGFEPGEPLGGTDDMLFVLRQRDITNLVAHVDQSPSNAEQGSRSIELRGNATSTSAHAIVRATATDLVIAPNDRLVYAMRIDAGTTSLTVGVDVQLDTGATAAELGLTDLSGFHVDPASTEGRVPGDYQRWVVDLSPAAGARLVGILFGFDARGGAAPGAFAAHLDDVLIESR